MPVIEIGFIFPSFLKNGFVDDYFGKQPLARRDDFQNTGREIMDKCNGCCEITEMMLNMTLIMFTTPWRIPTSLRKKFFLNKHYGKRKNLLVNGQHFPKRQILHSSELKEIAEDNFEFHVKGGESSLDG